MTVGNQNLLAWSPISTQCSGTDQYGFEHHKAWSGADRVKTPPVYVYLRNEEGKVYRKRVKTVRKEVPHEYQMNVQTLHRGVNYYLVRSNQLNCSSPLMFGKHAKLCFLALPSGGWGDDPFDANDQIKLLSKLHSKVHGSDFNLGVFLAEGMKSLGMIGERAQRIARAAAYTKKGLYRSAWDVLTAGTLQERRKVNLNRNFKGSANAWAEMRWGWSPLYNDMYDGAVWLAHKLNAPYAERLVVRRVKRRDYAEATENPGGFVPTTFSWIRKRQLIAYLTEPPHNAVFAAINPASIAWELVPYSFVVDWAIPISTYLTVRGLPSQLTGTFVTSDFSWKQSAGQKISQVNCPRYHTSTLGKNSKDDIFFTRSISTSLEVPLPVFKGFGSLATWGHAIDSLALMRQKLKRLD
ncbi:TPA_asm: maturation protein [ssRNA phage SRR7976356_5]|uniref:Maturation protein n=1 Tax=ssRNA phage SRR7976356_5 TaxID=2786736 RepID=A0A8S5L0Q5_9VIRU|nr:maturation protein [ssRNA phage SRR7976356_5]DAD51225.1 TPA_asm: maturation protein [ssRNA phage SRR7976356_5]